VLSVVQRLVFELCLLIARHGVDAEDLKHVIKLFDADRAPVVCCLVMLTISFSCVKCHSFAFLIIVSALLFHISEVFNILALYRSDYYYCYCYYKCKKNLAV